MADEEKTETGHPKHPDPKGRMVSYAKGHGPGPNGTTVEIPETEPTATPPAEPPQA